MHMQVLTSMDFGLATRSLAAFALASLLAVHGFRKKSLDRSGSVTIPSLSPRSNEINDIISGFHKTGRRIHSWLLLVLGKLSIRGYTYSLLSIIFYVDEI